ncbi:unnamed protein product [Caenorhabditis bovis]|uniref:Uncharacterized protein n=1 Tax=Caenorhabditis bovis TaxID=2654633 RepID=A0A8S1ERT9_9PELO|nr:unnamed protein product [Caenorhabditis bovis]
MQEANYPILLQNLFVVLVLLVPSWVVCCGKKKDKANARPNTNESIILKSGIKPPSEQAGPTVTPSKTENTAEKKEAPATNEQPEGEKKDEPPEPKEGKEKEKDKDTKAPVNQSMKPFPKFQPPTESARKRKEKENEEEKNRKIKEGFYQAKSDEDDTLEKIESLKVEKSDKTKRSQKNKKK